MGNEFRWPTFARLIIWLLLVAAAQSHSPADELLLNQRTRVETEPRSGQYHAQTEPVRWTAAETAIVLCDMWDDHYCRAAARRVAEMAPRMNQVISAARDRGVLIIHSPSGCMDQYADTPQRKRAKQAPEVTTEVPLQGWCHLDGDREPPLPIDASIPCEDKNPREAVRVFTRQIDTLKIESPDAVTDSAEAYYLMRQRGIKNVIVMGVHTNMCVLGRPFGIRQMVYQGQNVVLMRDMTDAMYNPACSPFVSHFTGNDLIVEHIERHWCPTITSADFLGGEPFRFPNDVRPHLVIVMADDEYRVAETLPDFALKQLGKHYRVSLVYASAADRNDLRGIEVLADADIALLAIRRRTLPTAQLKFVREFIQTDKPLVAIRTASHAFCLRRGAPGPGHDEWPEFDRQILGCHYTGHYGNELTATVQRIDTADGHPILEGIDSAPIQVFSSLYKVRPLSPAATPLMWGHVSASDQPEPVAWTLIRPGGGRVFYTSLGHPRDFELPAFQKLLVNALEWAVGTPTPAPAGADSDE